jgi:hypothetical protein
MSSTMQTPQAQQQSTSTTPASSLPVITYIRDLFAREGLNEFDLCYYETRKVALCAHLLKPK